MTALELAQAIEIKVQNYFADKHFDDEFGGLYVDFMYYCETADTGDGINEKLGFQVKNQSIIIKSIDAIDDYTGEIPNPNEVEEIFQTLTN